MKLHINILLILALLLCACTPELDDVGMEGGNCITLNVRNTSLQVKGTNPGTETERALRKLDCFFYAATDTTKNSVFHKRFSVEDPYSSNVSIYVNEETVNRIFPNKRAGETCFVYIIANLPEGVTFEDTKLPTLRRTLIEASFDDVDVTQTSFVMEGGGTATRDGEGNAASGEIKVRRAASKLTLSVRIPSSITVDITDTDGNKLEEEIWYPVFHIDDTPASGVIGMSAKLLNVVTDTYIHSDTLSNRSYEDTDPVEFKYDDTVDEKHIYTCDLPFYSYHSSWEHGSPDAPSFSIQISWQKKDTELYKTCYYQVMINNTGKQLARNHWYDLKVNVGVLGSTVESVPTVIQGDNVTYYVIDWSQETSQGDRKEEVNIQDWIYLVVPDHADTLSNEISGKLLFEASGEVTIETVEAYYYNYKSTSVKTVLPSGRYTLGKVTENGQTYIGFTHDFNSSQWYSNAANKIYSPIYITAKISLNENSTEFNDTVKFVQYPPIYFTAMSSYHGGETGWKDSKGTVFVNEYQYSGSGTYEIDDDKGNGIGSVTNPKNVTGDATGNVNRFQYTIYVSSFDSDNSPYLIGDPREETGDKLDGIDELINYRLTREDVGLVIAPEYKIASSYGKTTSISYKNAQRRCASYQENGYPAGRWRLPTQAEIEFIVQRSRDGVIPELFNGTYWGAGGYYDSKNSKWTSGTGGTNRAVRCVYDVWYWGNTQYDLYTPLWGDEEGEPKQK